MVSLLRGDPLDMPYAAPRQWILNQMPDQSTGAEIGVHEGDFSARILEEVRPTQLHLIDPWEHFPELGDAKYGERASGEEEMDRRFEMVNRRFSEQIERGQVQVHRSRSDDAVDLFEDHYFDWVYIDGNHLYEHVLQDLRSYIPKVKPGGMLMGDDYGVEGWWDDGVTRAVDEFTGRRGLNCETHGTQFILSKPEG